MYNFFSWESKAENIEDVILFQVIRLILLFRVLQESQFSCECNLARTPLTAKYNNESLKFEVKSGVIKRGCDCIKRNGLQDRCPRVRHESRWECLMGVPHGCTSGPAKPRPHYANHLQRPATLPYSNPCASVSDLSKTRRDVGVGHLTTSYCQHKPRAVTADQLRCVRSQVLPNTGYRNEMKGNSTSRKSQQLRPSTQESTNNCTNIVCACHPC